MQLIKKHYEKVLLSIVLLGLAIAAALLPFQVGQVRNYLDQVVSGVVETTPKPFTPVDLSTNQAVLRRLASPVKLTFTEPHNIFNPVQWQKRPDGVVVKVATSANIGASGLVVTRIEPLHLTVAYEGVDATNPENPRYKFIVTREGDTNPRKPQTATLNIPRNALFTLMEVAGSKEAPTAFKLRLKDEKEDIVVTADKPHSRVMGYVAELKYPIHNQNFGRSFRVKDTVRLTGDSEVYKIVAITADEVVLSAESTQKRTTLKFNASPPVK